MAQSARGMHPEDIKAKLRIRHGTARALAMTWGVHPSMITKVLANPGFSVRVERLIAEALGMSPHAVWPDRWTQAGDPLPRPGKTNRTRMQPVKTSQKREAA